MRFFRSTITSSIKIPATMHSFNGTVHFSDAKIAAIQFSYRSFFQRISKQGSEYALILNSKKLMDVQLGDLRFYYSIIYPNSRLLALDNQKKQQT